MNAVTSFETTAIQSRTNNSTENSRDGPEGGNHGSRLIDEFLGNLPNVTLNTIWIVASICAFIVFTLLTVLICMCCRRRRQMAKGVAKSARRSDRSSSSATGLPGSSGTGGDREADFGSPTSQGCNINTTAFTDITLNESCSPTGSATAAAATGAAAETNGDFADSPRFAELTARLFGTVGVRHQAAAAQMSEARRLSGIRTATLGNGLATASASLIGQQQQQRIIAAAAAAAANRNSGAPTNSKVMYEVVV